MSTRITDAGLLPHTPPPVLDGDDDAICAELGLRRAAGARGGPSDTLG